MEKFTLKASNVLASSSRTRRFSSALSIELLLLSELIALVTAADDLGKLFFIEFFFHLFLNYF